MLKLISPQDMLSSEKHYFETSRVPSIKIMERAAAALTDVVLARFPDAQIIHIACGPGGNGGDGYACARMLAQLGKTCSIYASAPAKSADAIENARRAGECGIEIHIEELPQAAPDLWIDCIYGTGLSRAPEGFALDLLCKIQYDHAHGSGTIACDIPSGLNGRTGKAYPGCIIADACVSFQFAKHGLVLQDGLDMCGEIIVADVGFPAEAFPENPIQLIQKKDLKSLFSPRWKRNMHKGSYGHLLIIAGSVGMAGAAALCAKAALRSGVGLVSIACPEEIVPILQNHAPCAMCIPLPSEGGAISVAALPILQKAFPGKSAIAVGPGWSRKVPPEIMRAILGCGLSAAIDADALNIISENPELKELIKPHHVITPHPGEAARLLGERCEDPIANAHALAQMGPTVILKGASRVIEGAQLRFISASGTNGMARGGSGDVLTGLLGALLADQNGNMPRPQPEIIAACACEVHGLAGELAHAKYGRAMNAADIIEFLPEVFKQYVD